MSLAALYSQNGKTAAVKVMGCRVAVALLSRIAVFMGGGDVVASLLKNHVDYPRWPAKSIESGGWAKANCDAVRPDLA